MLTFDVLRYAVTSCTAYDLEEAHLIDDDGDRTVWALIDPCGDQDGDDFETLEDVYDYITNNDQVAEFLSALNGRNIG